MDGLHRCDCKRNSSIDSYGDHLFTCPKGNHRQLSHNALNLVLSEMCHCAGIHNKTEPLGAFDRARSTTNKRPDLILYKPGIATVKYPKGWLHNIVVDTSLTYPMTQDSINKVARQPNALLSIDKREKEKIYKYGDLAAASDLDIVPAVVDYWGAWGEHIRRLVFEVCKIGSAQTDITFSVFKEYWTQRISVVVQ